MSNKRYSSGGHTLTLNIQELRDNTQQSIDDLNRRALRLLNDIDQRSEDDNIEIIIDEQKGTISAILNNFSTQAELMSRIKECIAEKKLTFKPITALNPAADSEESLGVERPLQSGDPPRL